MNRIFEYKENEKMLVVKTLDEGDFNKEVFFLKEVESDKFEIRDNGKVLYIKLTDEPQLYGILKNGLIVEITDASPEQIELYENLIW